MTSRKRKKENKEYIKNNFLFEIGTILKFNSWSTNYNSDPSLIVLQTIPSDFGTMVYKVLVLKNMSIIALDKEFIEERYCKV